MQGVHTAVKKAKILQKVVYLEHRAFLPLIDCLCKTQMNFPSKTIPKYPSVPKTVSFICESITSLPTARTAHERKAIMQST